MAWRVPLCKTLLLACGVPPAPEGFRVPAPRGREAPPAISTVRALRWVQGKKGEVSISLILNPSQTGFSISESFPAVPNSGEFAGRGEWAEPHARTRLQTRVLCFCSHRRFLLPARDLSDPKLSSHKYPSEWQETCFF